MLNFIMELLDGSFGWAIITPVIPLLLSLSLLILFYRSDNKLVRKIAPWTAFGSGAALALLFGLLTVAHNGNSNVVARGKRVDIAEMLIDHADKAIHTIAFVALSSVIILAIFAIIMIVSYLRPKGTR